MNSCAETPSSLAAKEKLPIASNGQANTAGAFPNDDDDVEALITRLINQASGESSGI
jgi:hypothetical protein